MAIFGKHDPKIFMPGYRLEITNDRQAQLYNRILKVKIAVQIVLIGLLLCMAGWNWQLLLAVAAVAAVWQIGSSWLDRRARRNGGRRG